MNNGYNSYSENLPTSLLSHPRMPKNTEIKKIQTEGK